MTNKKFKASKGAISIIRKNIQRYGTELERIREEYFMTILNGMMKKLATTGD